MDTVRVMYVGLKGREVDNKKGKTGIVWEFHGDIKDVPASAWPALAVHPDVWIEVPPEPGEKPAAVTGLSDVLPAKVPQEVDDADLVAMTVTAQPPEQSAAADLYNMNTAALREYAVGKGYRVDLSLKAKDLRAAIQAIEAA
jgi:hypothetical protein